ncbi:hypothetical protein [Nocardioides acrostichi]|uniref:DUF8017 domain-containing protein n=1 Tax=Nocardioides acrostichi TaxID=2784339 RepID=A0A930Y8C6_9ACTN|nr:hypothetical protein [Nocardioides acrostichi]MBF4162921.1 hypothetical protein [Nocardioides acrostichi]
MTRPTPSHVARPPRAPGQVRTRALWCVVALCLALTAGSGIAMALRAPSEPAPPSAPVLHLGGLDVPLPASFEATDPGTRLFYPGRRGQPLAVVTGAAVLEPGVCPEVPDSSRGFVGLAEVSDQRLLAAHRAALRRWRTGLAIGVGGRPRVHRVDAGEGRMRTDLVLRNRRNGPCQPPRVAVSVLSARTSRGVATIVLVRDVGVDGALGDAAADLLLDGARASAVARGGTSVQADLRGTPTLRNS